MDSIWHRDLPKLDVVSDEFLVRNTELTRSLLSLDTGSWVMLRYLPPAAVGENGPRPIGCRLTQTAQLGWHQVPKVADRDILESRVIRAQAQVLASISPSTTLTSTAAPVPAQASHRSAAYFVNLFRWPLWLTAGGGSSDGVTGGMTRLGGLNCRRGVSG